MSSPFAGSKISSSVRQEPARKVAIATLGCKLNQVESEAILTQFRGRGYEVTDDPVQADVCVVNTCVVTAAAEQKARTLLRSLYRRNPHAQLLAVGCMAESAADVLTQMGGVNLVLGNREKEHLFDFLPEQRGDLAARVFVGETSAADVFDPPFPVEAMLGRTRAFIKVQDGCSQKCTYCIIPRVRGRGRSLPIRNVVEQARRLADHGFVEIVLTGVALGTYGDDWGAKNALPTLFKELHLVPNLRRIRLSSVEPWAVSDELLRVMADSEKICPHLHLSLQSAEDSVLHRMNRRYSVAQIAKIFDYAFHLRDDWGFGADIIAGFPGEGEREFAATNRFLAESPLSYLHVFPYSARPQTPALKLPQHVDGGAKKRRVTILKTTDGALRRNFRARHVGKTIPVLFEKRRVDGLLAGHAANYLDVYSIAADDAAGTVRPVHVSCSHPRGVVGEILE
jgi:threonylcarbamoyladenosine tRNA methylthiotransferase MtaB